jgi:hypothetical protein
MKDELDETRPIEPKRAPRNVGKEHGRPPKEIDRNQLEILCRLGALQDDVCSYLGVTSGTVSKFIRQNYDLTFSEFRHMQMAKIKYRTLNKIAIHVDRELDKTTGRVNNQLIIFAAKNLCGWSEKIETVNETNITSNAAPTIVFGFQKPETKVIDAPDDSNDGAGQVSIPT